MLQGLFVKHWVIERTGLLFLMIWSLIPFHVHARQQDSLRFSLLTCTPGSQIYALFGHTGIRYQNFSRNIDLVFNYGMFDFNTPGFIFRFVKGDTDYQLGIIPYNDFEREYKARGSFVYRQELNLTDAEKERLSELLAENYRLENRIYRYNYFYDNCTTRALKQIERSIHGKVFFQKGKKNVSFRNIVREFTAVSPWSGLGIDLCLGAEADKPIDIRKQMFSPLYMRDFANKAYIVNENGSTRPLVSREIKVMDIGETGADRQSYLSPFVFFSVFLLLNMVIAYRQWKRRKIYWLWDILLYGLQGVAGCVVTFLFFVSSHPTVGSNWLVLVLNPLPLVYLPRMIYCGINRKRDPYHLFNSLYLGVYLLMVPFLSQVFHGTILLFLLTLWINTISHILAVRSIDFNA